MVLEGLTCTGKDTIVKEYLILHFRAMGIKCEFNAEPNSDNVFGIIARKIVDKEPVLIDEYERAARKAEVITEFFERDGKSATFWYHARNLFNHLITHSASRLTPLEFQIPFIADGYEDLKEIIIPKTKNGISIFQPRYRMSTLAYSGQPMSIVKDIINSSFGLLNKNPDVTYFIRIKPETAIKRLQDSGKLPDHFEKKFESVKRAYNVYEEIIKNSLNEEIVIIDGERPMGEIASEIIKNLEKRYELRY